MKMPIKEIIATLFTILIAIISYNACDIQISLSVGHILIAIIGILWLSFIVLDVLLNNYKRYNSKISELKKQILLQDDQINKLKSENTVSIGSSEEGNNLLFMALTQDPTEPLKISLLKKSAEQHKNIIAALILGNIYEYGVKKDGEILIEEDKEKASEIYESICRYDDSGVSDWMLGWHYQHAFIKAAKMLSDEKRWEKARQYYEASQKKGFPKAMNSLGNFVIYERAGFDSKKDKDIMISYYNQASKKEDNYATLNLGHYYLTEYCSQKNRKFLEKARDLYKQSTEMNSPEGFVKLGIVNIEFYNLTNDLEYLEEAKSNFVASISHGANQFAAVGYCLLGNLLNLYPDFCKDNEVMRSVPLERYNNYTIECYVKSYEMFLSLLSQGKLISNENKNYFNLLTASFQNIKIDTLNFSSRY